MPRKARTCTHRDIYIDCSPEARECGFERPPAGKRLAAATSSGRVAASSQHYATPETLFSDGEVFPGPLVLPDELLAIEPKHHSQSFKSWHQSANYYGMRVTKRRNAIYVIPPPEVTDEVKDLMAGWLDPVVPRGESVRGMPKDLEQPTVDDLCDYLGAFYHGMEIRKLEPGFRWVAWDGNNSKSESNEPERPRIGLATPAPTSEVVGVQYRPSIDGIATQQVNLNDVLDAMIPLVPADAHSIVMMIHHDLYEDEDDDFCCGRAYGGSRVCLVTTFRYHPCLDRYAGINTEHSWPAAHCKSYVEALCRTSPPPAKRARGADSPPSHMVIRRNPSTPLGAAIESSRGKLAPRTRADYHGLWFSRAARTISHEIGHCVTLDHCIYFACVMQGTASIVEDMHQPPYCCPVCIEKLSYNMCVLGGPAKSKSTVELQRAWIRGQHRALAEVCRKWSHVGMFAGLGGWLEKRLAAVDVDGEDDEDEVVYMGTRPADEDGSAKGAASSKLFAQWLDDD